MHTQFLFLRRASSVMQKRHLIFSLQNRSLRRYCRQPRLSPVHRQELQLQSLARAQAESREHNVTGAKTMQDSQL